MATDIVDKIMRWEDGAMSKGETVEFFQELIDSGQAWTLQGMYGRTAKALIDAGLCRKAIPDLAKHRESWAKWLNGYGAEKLFDSIIYNVQGAESTCVYCGETITCDIIEGGGVPDWGVDGDYGCPDSPETNEEGCGGHMPRRKQ